MKSDAQIRTTFDQLLPQPPLTVVGSQALSERNHPPLRVIGANSFLALNLPPREPILGEWLTRKSLNMLYAPRGIGKTWVSLAVAIAVASGGRFAAWEAPFPLKVLVIDGEMPATALQERIHALKHTAGPDGLDHLALLAADYQDRAMPDLASLEGQAEVEPFCNNADLVVIDNLASLVRSGRENEREGWLAVQDWLLQLRRAGKAVLLVHHAGKGGDQRGTSSREDVLDTVVKLCRPADYAEADGCRVEWTFTKARGFHGEAAQPLEIVLETGPDGLTWTHRSLEESHLIQVVALVNEGSSVRDIADETGISKSKVGRLRKRAEAMGLVDRGKGTHAGTN